MAIFGILESMTLQKSGDSLFKGSGGLIGVWFILRSSAEH